MIWLIALGMVALVILVAVLATPARVAYVETVVIDAPAREIYDHIRFQDRLMRWSAWPSETGSACVREGADGEIGARTIFLTKAGARFGFQELTALDSGRRVQLRLQSKGPPQKPVLTFDLEAMTPDTTRVRLGFDNQIARPFNVLLRLFGIVRWTRAMHGKDLDGLKRYAEPPHRTYTGEPATELRAA